jgi:hypothetical protein
MAGVGVLRAREEADMNEDYDHPKIDRIIDAAQMGGEILLAMIGFPFAMWGLWRDRKEED